MSAVIQSTGQLFLEKLIGKDLASDISNHTQLEIYAEFVKLYVESLYDSILELQKEDWIDTQKDIKVVLAKIQRVLATEITEDLTRKFNILKDELIAIQQDIHALLSPQEEIDENSPEYNELLGFIAQESLKSGLVQH